MEIRIKKMLSWAFIIFLPICTLGQKIGASNELTLQRELLMDYGLCKCLNFGFSKDSLLKKDYSTTVLVEQLNYSPETLTYLDSVIKIYTDSFLESSYQDVRGKKGVMINCIEYYKSREFKLLVQRFDKQILGKN